MRNAAQCAAPQVACGRGQLWPQSVYYSKKHSFSHNPQVGSSISAGLLAQCEALGILVDRDDQGVLLQIFTKPLGACQYWY